jgi:hypothetical protein
LSFGAAVPVDARPFTLDLYGGKPASPVKPDRVLVGFQCYAHEPEFFYYLFDKALADSFFPVVRVNSQVEYPSVG